MPHPLPEGLHEVGWLPDEAFTRIDELLKNIVPATERLSFSRFAEHPSEGFSDAQEEQIEEAVLPLVADLDTPLSELSLGIDFRGQGYYGRQGAKRQSFWHSEASSRSTSNLAHLATWFLVDRRPVNPDIELRALTGRMLGSEYGLDPTNMSYLTAEELAVFGLAIYQDVPGRIIDYSRILHRVPGDLYEHPDCGQRIFARVTVF